MKLRFVKVNPVENMTIFILDEVDNKKHIEVAKKLMSYGSLNAEQVGFVQKPVHTYDTNCNMRLQMMGNEFCGNATRSLAAYAVYKGCENVEEKDGRYFVDIETSGLDKIIKCEVEKTQKENVYLSKIQMPLPKKELTKSIIDIEGRAIETYRVDFDGITHFVVNSSYIEDEEYFFKKIQCIMQNEEYEAFGVMFLDFDKIYLKPLVYVKATDSLFWERSCASGTCAVGLVLAHKNEGDIVKDVVQPGGILQIQTNIYGGDVKSLFLNGTVEIVAQGDVIL